MPISLPLFFFLNLENSQHTQLHMIQPLEVAQNENKNIFFKYFFQLQFSPPLASFPKAHLFYPALAFCSL